MSFGSVTASRTEIDAAYAAYDEHPLDEPDEWGDLSSWCEAARRTVSIDAEPWNQIESGGVET